MVRLDTCSFGVDRYNEHSVQPGRAQPCQSSELISGGVNHPKSQFRNFPDVLALTQAVKTGYSCQY